MTTDELDPLIHVPTRLKIVATLAALPDGDTLSVPRLQDMIRLPPGGLITCLRELGRAGHVRTGTTGGDRAPTTVALTCDGRAALDHLHRRAAAAARGGQAGSSGTTTRHARWRRRPGGGSRGPG